MEFKGTYKYGKTGKPKISEAERAKLPRSRCREAWDAYVKDCVLPRILPERLADDVMKYGSNDVEVPKKSNVFIHGPIRMGKSILAASIYVEWYYSEVWQKSTEMKSGMFITMSWFMKLLKDSINNPDISEGKILDYLACADFLVLDDFGTEIMGDWTYQSLYYVISERYNRVLPTVYTSNYSPQELMDKMGDDRMVRRMTADCKIIKRSKE